MADFRQHVTAHLLQTVFKRHDQSRVEAHGFALNADDKGSFRRSISESFGPGRSLCPYAAATRCPVLTYGVPPYYQAASTRRIAYRTPKSQY
eukprot:808927-Rhodomonas_salina.1